MKIFRTCIIVGIGTLFLSSLACQKTKVDQAAAILDDMMDIWISTFEDFFDMVGSNYDICNKCVRDADKLLEQRRGQMNTLYSKWKDLSAQMSTKERLDAIEKTRKKYEEYIAKTEEMENENYETFEEFNKHCSGVTPKVYRKMQKAKNLYYGFMETEY